MEVFERVERELLEALRQGDFRTLDALIRDDFLITTAGWLPEPVGKRAWLDAALAEHRLEAFDLQVMHVRGYGDVAVVLAESTQSGTHDREAWSLSFRYTDVWVRDDGRWQLAVRHASPAISAERA